MAKVNVYIDGLNLYYGALKGTPYKWLNLASLRQALLPSDRIQEIKYFHGEGKRQAEQPDFRSRSRSVHSSVADNPEPDDQIW